jgi:hypothetical protein
LVSTKPPHLPPLFLFSLFVFLAKKCGAKAPQHSTKYILKKGGESTEEHLQSS